MKILRAKFTNFRLLRDVEIDFSTDPAKNLTVIRAENESGKTTILTALQWGLYGDDALPGGASEFRLHPINWQDSNSAASISVEIDIEIVRERKTRQRKSLRQTKVYRVIRTAFETPSGNEWKRDSSSVTLHEQTDAGWEAIRLPERILAEELPPELREVFFTDGDRALSFVEADSRASKRYRVERSIKSLLGLDVINTALGHIKNTSRKFNREAQDAGASEDINKVVSKLESVASEIDRHQGIVAESALSVANIDNQLSEVNKRITEALRKGDRTALEKQLSRVNADWERVRAGIKASSDAHTNLFKSLAFSRDVIGQPLTEALEELDKLRAQKRFPKASIPVLEDVLEAQECVCGASLDPNEGAAHSKREHIQALIEDSRKADELQNALTDLYFTSRALLETLQSGNDSWTNQFNKVAERRDDLEGRLKDLGEETRELEAQIGQLSDADVGELQASQQSLRNMRERKSDERVRSQTELSHLSARSERLSRKRDRLLREETRGARILANLRVAQDVESVLDRAYSRIKQEELVKVSNLMNTYFLEMIGSDPEQSSIIRRAEISEEYDIVVYGGGGRELRPDHDINGASRRALTLAFILSLTKVSEAVAPNIIDTPLGMMSGYVKRSVLETASRESSQLILFLTRSEIAGCEDIIDEKAGKVFTLTNTGHYPRMLQYEPDAEVSQVVRCACDHRSACRICQRRGLDSAAS